MTWKWALVGVGIYLLVVAAMLAFMHGGTRD